MNSVLPAKGTKFAEFQTFRMELLVLIGDVIPPPASGALKLYEFSHKWLYSIKKKVKQ